jgi:Pectate lyase superfamily protein/Calx-beta domain
MLRKRQRKPLLGLSKVRLLVLLGLFSLTAFLGMTVTTAIAPSRPTVSFELSASRVFENTSTAGITVNLSAASRKTVAVDYAVTDSSAKDDILQQGSLTFEAGTVTQSISIPIIDDSNDQGDRTLEVALSNPSHAVLSANPSHTLQIISIDKPKKAIVDNVKDFGAVGDGITDGTQAIQKAIDTVYSQGGGEIVFPSGEYLVTSVKLKDNITYSGFGATIKRPANQDKWMRTFVAEYAGEEDSKPLIIQGFTFDGNSQNQGSYQDYELEQAHLIFLEGSSDFPGKLKAYIKNCTFKNGVADAISVYTNVDVKVDNVEAINVFRGGFVLIGGNSSAQVHNLTTRGEIDDTGIDIEIDGRGYGNSLKVDVILENLNLIDGDFDVAVEEGSTVTGNNIFADAPFYLFALNSTIKLTNSQFKVGAADGKSNRIVFPHDVTFENCEFYATRKETGESYQFFSIADVWWQHRGYRTQQNQRLIFKNSSFKVDSNINETDTTYAIHLRENSPVNNNRLILEGVKFSKEFDAEIVKDE